MIFSELKHTLTAWWVSDGLVRICGCYESSLNISQKFPRVGFHTTDTTVHSDPKVTCGKSDPPRLPIVCTKTARKAPTKNSLARLGHKPSRKIVEPDDSGYEPHIADDHLRHPPTSRLSIFPSPTGRKKQQSCRRLPRACNASARRRRPPPLPTARCVRARVGVG
jgi:hypothetical protein